MIKTDCKHYDPTSGKDGADGCKLRNDWLTPCDKCESYQSMRKQTNADRIRAKSDEELAEYLFDRGNCQEYCYGICDIQDECNGSPSDAHCISHIVKWLQKEVEE